MQLVVNGEAIEDSLVREEANHLRSSYYEMMGGGDPIELEMQLREWSKENVIERTLLRQAAPEGKVEELLERLASEAPTPSQKEVAEYYKAHSEDFYTPELVHAWHIFQAVDEEQDEPTALGKIQQAERDLQSGVLFDSLAEELGWIPRGRMDEQIEREIFGLEIRQSSRVLRSTAGFHIVRITERRAEGVATFEEAREHVEAVLLRARHQAAIESYIDGLKATAQIQGR